MDKFIKTAIQSAKISGEYLTKAFRNDSNSINRRGLSKELNSESDHESDMIIIGNIEKAFPTHDILTEETGLISKGSKYTWIIDPLDGSSNFLNHNPYFSVSIALAHEKELIAGVIYAPYLNELVVAEKGKGCYLNGKQVKVSDTRNYKKSYIVGCEGGETSNSRFSKLGYTLHQNIKDFRKIGSAAIEGYLVATGRVDAFTTLNISSWDVAAAILCVQEAGGKISDFHGNPWNFEKTDLLLSNGHLHNHILNELSVIKLEHEISSIR